MIKNFFRKRKWKREDRREERAKRKAEKIREQELIKGKETKNKIIFFPTPEYSITLNNIFPNPFSEEINLNLTSSEKCDIHISVFDLTGKKLYTVTQGVMEGNQNIHLNLKNIDLKDESYILHIREKNGQVQSKKLVRLLEEKIKLKK